MICGSSFRVCHGAPSAAVAHETLGYANIMARANTINHRGVNAMKTEAKSVLKATACLLITLVFASESFAQTGPAFQYKTNEIIEVRRVLRQASQIADSVAEQWKA